MQAPSRLIFFAAVWLLLSGCKLAPQAEWNALEARNRALAEQNRAQETEIENLRQHGRTLEDRLIEGEKQIALLKERGEIDRELECFRRERDELHGAGAKR